MHQQVNTEAFTEGTHNIHAHEPTLADRFGLQHVRILYHDPATGLQQMTHCFLVDMGKYLPVYLDEKRVGKLAE